MDKDTKRMLKQVFIYDIVILALSLAVSVLFFQKYAFVIIAGLALAEFNFVMNALITSYTIRNKWNASFHVLGAMIRLILTVSVVAMLFGNNIYNLITFLTGYTLHYLVIIFYGITQGKKIKKERK